MDALHVSFFSEDTNFQFDESQKKVIAWLDQTFKTENVNASALNYIFCSDDYLLEINKQHLDHDYYTDIITFTLETDPIESDIFISIDRVKENAQALKVSFEEELYRVMIHGVLHLCGYHDHSEQEKGQMRQKENYYLGQLSLL